MKGLYIHIPFCVRKCSYCDFYSLPNRQSAIADYVQAVLQEAGSFPLSQRGIKGDLQPLKNPSFQTLYLGGGTPSLLGPQNLQTLISGLMVSSLAPGGRELERGGSPAVATLSLLESTLEVNPESASPEFLRTAKTY